MFKESPLGQKTAYVENYDPTLLYPISRSLARDKILLKSLPFFGGDFWTGYEISWLDLKGKPEIAFLEIYFPATSPFLIESKSLKLYFNSFNQTKFISEKEVQELIQKDLSFVSGGPVDVKLSQNASKNIGNFQEFSGICLDAIDLETDIYEVYPAFLKTHRLEVEESVYTHLLKSNCLATGQPDWGSLLIKYKGPKIDHEGLLKYIISFRRHSGFAEHCVERIFSDIFSLCSPKLLTVYARYTRRGGLDINPFRSNFEMAPISFRQIRQ